MVKLPRRKPPKRKPAREPIDDDLAELAAILDEQRLDKNATGWFWVAWRNGWNAIALALDAAMVVDKAEESKAPLAALAQLVLNEELTATGYFAAGEVLEQKLLHPISRAAFRCYQILAARSDAGGDGYNQILRSVFETYPSEQFEALIRTWRMRDALGIFHDERRRVAFEIAWRRGLFKAAYAV